jgi:uncharacterized protein YkwD
MGLPVLMCLVGLLGSGLHASTAQASTAPSSPAQASTARAASASQDTTQAEPTTLSTAEFGSRLLTRMNHRRAGQGCRQFRLSPALVLAAQRHTDAMVASRQLSHRLAGEADLGARAVSAGYTHWRILAENLAWGQAGPRAVLRAWVHSPGHRANLDNCRLRDVGLGIAIRGGRPWVTADFGRRRT